MGSLASEEGGASSDLLGINVEASVELDLLQAHLFSLL
jgi:hypothetical protein